MGATVTGIKWDRVLVDICTQHDYLDNGSIMQVVNRDTLIPNLKKVFQWANAARMPLVSIVESHRPTEPVNGIPLHCIDDTPGQKKLDFTLLKPWTLVEADNSLSLPPCLTEKHRQIIFRKRTKDVLSNPKADCFLTSSPVQEYIIFGVGLERAIKGLALGLLARHKNVTVIPDACGAWSLADAELAARQLAAKGIKLMTVAELTAMPVATPRRSVAQVRQPADRHHPVEAPRSRGRVRALAG